MRPDLGKSLRLLDPYPRDARIVGQPLPPELFTQPALCSSAPVRSPICHHGPMGNVTSRWVLVVAFLSGPSRSRCRSGWVTSPRIVISPLISLNGQRLGRVGGICPARCPVCSGGLTSPLQAHGSGTGWRQVARSTAARAISNCSGLAASRSS